MTEGPDIFEFVSYVVQPDKKTINFSYKTQGLHFTEKIILPDEIPSSVENKLLNKVLESLHLILGVTYFKTYCSKKIITPYSLSKAQADFLA